MASFSSRIEIWDFFCKQAQFCRGSPATGTLFMEDDFDNAPWYLWVLTHVELLWVLCLDKGPTKEE